MEKKKLKVGQVVGVFVKRTPMEKPILYKVLDSITNFTRKLELRYFVKELKEINEEFNDHQQKMVDTFIDRWVKEKNEIRDKNQPEIKKESIKRVPEEFMPEFRKETQKLLDEEIVLKNYKRFTLKEIEMSKIDYSDFELMEEFIDFETTSVKLKKPE